MITKSRWIGAEGAAFARVGLAFEQLGYRAPRADDGTNGVGGYAMNIARQYAANMSERQALAVIAYALDSSRAELQSRTNVSLNEIEGRYGE